MLYLSSAPLMKHDPIRGQTKVGALRPVALKIWQGPTK